MMDNTDTTRVVTRMHQLGGQWDADTGTWLVPPERVGDLVVLLKELGLDVERADASADES